MMSDGVIIKIFLAVFIAMFVLQAIFPEQAWWIEHGMPKDTEPSDAGILVTRIGGIILAIIGVILFFNSFN